MTDAQDLLAERFEAHRAQLRAVAYRMLGSASEADDAVQEAWLRLSRSDAEAVQNLAGWLTTVVARVCLDMLRSRSSRREEPLGEHQPEPAATGGDGAAPEHEAVLADSVGQAMLVVLDTLAPAERLAFVLHDMFAVPFGEIAVILGRSPAAAKQLASRGRRRLQGTGGPAQAGRDRQREVVRAFLAAARDGDFEALLTLLDPDAEMRADEAAVRIGAAPLVRGAAQVAGIFAGGAKTARLALVDGVPGLAWAQGGQLRVVFAVTLARGKIAQIELIAAQDRLDRIDLEFLPLRPPSDT